MIASFLLALFTLFASWADQPAPEPLPVPVPVAVEAPAPVVTEGEAPTTPHYAPPSAEPGCAAGLEWQGEFGCVAVQLPGEVTGRAYG